ncbi:hypothetical protein AB4160_01255 [Shewanella sp. 10N.286.51.B8]|uniref:hypothetical protein n=1 Tax=Shewanella sp. 10N.286.51.B8 TaxID=3229708 RepID=UPI00354CBF34
MSVNGKGLYAVKNTVAFFVLHCCFGLAVSHANESLTLALSGVIEDKCEITIPSSSPFDFSQQLIHSTTLSIDCNQTMLVALRSEYGGLKLNQTQDENRIIAAYDIDLKIESIQFNMSANSFDIQQEQRFNAGEKIPFATSGSLEISLPEALVYAGKYTDILHVEVYPNFTMQGI